MKTFDYHRQHRGVALVVSLLFLLVVTVISLIAASNSSMGMKMSTNMADASASFQSAEAGVIAVLALAKSQQGTANDPLKGVVDPDFDRDHDPFENFDPDSDHPLNTLNDGVDAMTVRVFVTNLAAACPRSEEGSSYGLVDCDYYRVESEHDVDKQARTKVNLGVVKTIIGI